jgi:hypothetical protein
MQADAERPRSRGDSQRPFFARVHEKTSGLSIERSLSGNSYDSPMASNIGVWKPQVALLQPRVVTLRERIRSTGDHRVPGAKHTCTFLICTMAD